MQIKSLIFIVIVAVILASCERGTQKIFDVFDAVPETTSLLIKTENSDTVSELVSRNNPLVSMFYNTKSELNFPLCYVADSLKKSGMFGTYLLQEAVFGVRKDGNCGLSQLYVCKTDLAESDEILSVIENFKNFGTIETRKIGEIDAVKFKGNGINSSVSLCFVNGLMIMSSSAKYLEDAISCCLGNAKRLIDNQSFKSAFETSGKNELANVLIDTKSFLSIFNSELFDDNKLVKVVNSFDCWLELDIVETSPMAFSGFEFPKSDSSRFSAFVKSQPSIEFNTLSVIPEKSSAYILMSFGNSAEYEKTLDEYLLSVGTKKYRDGLVADMNKAFGCDAKSKFYSLVNREFAYCAVENDADRQKGAYLICGLLSQSAAELELKKMVPENMQISLDDASATKVFQLPYDDIPAALFGDLFSNCRGNYVFFVNNFMIFANSLSDVKSLLREINLNNTMKLSVSHNEFLEKFSTTSSIFAYYSFASGQEIMKRVFSPQYAGDFDKNRAEISQMGIVGVQLKKLDDMVYCNVAFAEAEHKEAESETIWEANIGTALATKPYIVKNHDTGEKEIIFQDKKNVLYLFDMSGSEIWHIQLDETIISPIVQVDAYKNDKLQYLFSTKNKIYIVDRIGNFLPQFPLSLRAEASTPIAVFDYEKNRNYRIAVACNDKKVYVYDITGTLLKGWEFAGTENNITSDFAHYVISTEDFIVFHDDYKAYFIARNGSSKMEFQTKFKFSRNNIYCDLSNTPKFVTTDENGIVRRFFKNKSQDSIVLDKFSDKHNFAMKDIDSDGRLDYVFTDSTTLVVYGADKRKLFDYDFESEISAPAFYQFSGQTKIGIVANNKKLYLLNSNGTLYEGFPLNGETNFSISETDSENYSLLSGSARGCLYNYRINK